MIDNDNYILPTHTQDTWQLIKTAVAIWKYAFFQVVIFSVILEIVSNLSLLDYFNHINKYSILIVRVAVLIFFCLVNIIIIYRIDKLVHNQNINFYDTLSVGIKKLLPFIAVSIIYILVTAIGMLLLVIPGIMASVYFIFISYLVVIEPDITIMKCIKLSYELVRGQWWRISWYISIIFLGFILILAVILIAIMCLFLGEIIIEYFVHSSLNKAFFDSTIKDINLIIKVITSVTNIFVTPLLHASMLAILYNLRIKNKEKIL